MNMDYLKDSKILQYDTTFAPKDFEIFENIFKNGNLANGEYQNLLRDRLKDMTGCKHVFLTSSGTAALHISLLALGISKNDDVVIPSYLCQEVLNSIMYVGAVPNFVDINSLNYSINFENTKTSISEKTKAMIIPYMYGDIFSIKELKKLEIPIIEDLAHCTGGAINGKKLGSHGDIAMTSFGDRKFLDGGFGGAIFTNDESLAEKIQLFLSPSSHHYKMNFNYQIPNIIAAIIYEKSFLLDNQIDKRKQIAQRYLEELKDLVDIRYDSVNSSFFHRFMLDIKGSKKQFIDHMFSNGIICGVGVDNPLHIMYGNQLHLPNTDFASKQSIALPIRPNLSDTEVDFIIKSTKSLLI